MFQLGPIVPRIQSRKQVCGAGGGLPATEPEDALHPLPRRHHHHPPRPPSCQEGHPVAYFETPPFP